MFIQIINGRCTRQDEMQAALERWRTDCEPGADGWLGGTYGFTDDDEFLAVVRFESEEAAMANSGRPEQGAWWEQTEPLFEGPVEFHNSSNVVLMMDGGSDDAGFVQVIHGKIDEPEKAKAMMEQMTSLLHEARPDILGATMAIEEDGTFTETVAFTDEAAARAGESKELPEALTRMMDTSMLHEESYRDLHHPWFRLTLLRHTRAR